MKIETTEELFKFRNGNEEKYTTHNVEYNGSVFWFDNDDEPELWDMIAALISKGEFYISDNKNVLQCWVNCNDVFAWGCADGEDISPDEIKDLFFMVVENNAWGSLKWCCIKRNERPQIPIEEDMKKAGVWCERMEALPINQYWDRLRQRKEVKNEEEKENKIK